MKKKPNEILEEKVSATHRMNVFDAVSSALEEKSIASKRRQHLQWWGWLAAATTAGLGAFMFIRSPSKQDNESFQLATEVLDKDPEMLAELELLEDLEILEDWEMIEQWVDDEA